MAKVPDTLLVILDEAYLEFVTDPQAVDGIPLLERYPNLVVLRTFSKAYGLAGLRDRLRGRTGLHSGCRASAAIPLSVTEPAQRAALAALDAEAELLARVADLNGRRDRVSRGLTEQGWPCPSRRATSSGSPTGDSHGGRRR